MDALAAASFIRALPQLVEVELSDFNWVRGDGGARLTFDVLRGLEKIQSLRLAGCAPLRPSLLTQPWRSSLTSLDLAEDDNSNMPSLQVMLVHHGETLRSLSLPPYRDQDHFPPFSLPHLDHLKLSLTQRSAALPLAFSTAPLRKLEVRMVGLHGGIKEMLDSTKEAVTQHHATLEKLKVTGYGRLARSDDQKALDRLEVLCKQQQISYAFHTRNL